MSDTRTIRWIPDTAIDQLEAKLTEAMANCERVEMQNIQLERERNELRGAMARLCRAVTRRMMPDEPTPEDRLELMEAYEQAVGIIERTNQELTNDK